ncbi:MAG: hypothetical protein N2Z72_03480, partial [Bacteroidales bacterium]|nr:hypothetical protein [Bacteroidales bacterium]
MKTKFITLITIGLGLVFLTGCSINNYYSKHYHEYDDVYAKPQKQINSYEVEQDVKPFTDEQINYSYQDSNPSENYSQGSGKSYPSTSTTYTDQNGNTYITNNYYYDDYYDYEYTARLRRFYGGGWFDYYDPFYTNLYWYTYDPFLFGISVYYTPWWWWKPRYRWYWGWYFPYYHYYGWGYTPGYYWGWNYGYWHGYHDGYWDGYWNGYWDGYWDSHYGPSYYYYNSYDLYSNNNIYYGPRVNDIGGSYINPMASSGGNSQGKLSFGDRYEQAIARGEITNTHGISVSKFVNRPATQNVNTQIDINAGGADSRISGSQNTSRVSTQSSLTPDQNAFVKPISSEDSRGEVKPGIRPSDANSNSSGSLQRPQPNSVNSPGTSIMPDVNQSSGFQPSSRPQQTPNYNQPTYEMNNSGGQVPS